MEGFNIDNACDQLSELSEAITTILCQLSMNKVERGCEGWEEVFKWKKKAQYALAIKQVEHSILKCEIKVYRRRIKEEAEARNEIKKMARVNRAISRDQLFIDALKDSISECIGAVSAKVMFENCGYTADLKLNEFATD